MLRQWFEETVKPILLFLVMCAVLLAIMTAVLLTFPPVARAYDVAVNAGAIEVVGVPEGTHFGVYPYAGASVVVPVGEKFTLIPGLEIEYSPEFERWGFVGTLVLDRALTDYLGLDVSLAFIHDQEGFNWDEAAYFLGAGPGFSVFLGKWTISPFVNVFHGLNVPGWVLVPGLNLGYTL